MSDTVYSNFKNIVENNREKTAIIENNRTLSFGELSDMVDTIADSFPENTNSVGIIMNHRAEMIASILAVLKCGARYVPAEPDFPIDRIRYMMNEAEVDFILTEREYMYKLSEFPSRLVDCEICNVILPHRDRTDEVSPDSPAYVLYTSGTTGHPKGVCVTNKNLCHYVRAFNAEFKLGEDDIMLQNSVCTFDIFVEEVFGALLNGAAIAIPSEDDKSDIHSLMKFVEKNKVTIISAFPYLLAEMNHLSAIPSSLRLLISGGDILRDVYVDKLLNQALVYNTYGPSETTVCATYYRLNDGTVLEDGTFPIGKPVEGAGIKILDQKGEETQTGEIGEICIYGDGVSLGYIGDHEEENKAFTHSGEQMMYRSGDFGYYLPDGNIAFLHRKDTQIMIYGKRVEVSEVESQLYQCEGVQQAVVRSLTDENNLSYMVAYVVSDDENLKLSTLKKELSKNLTSYMIPEFFVKVPVIPVNSNGKPDLTRLPVVMKAGDY